MNHAIYYTAILLSLSVFSAFAQTESADTTNRQFPYSRITLEPAVGVRPMPMADLVFSNLIQWNVQKRFSVVSRTSVTFNTAFERNFNYIHTDYSYTLSQTVGIGTSLYLNHSSHTFSLMAGVKYDATRETLDNPDYEKISMSVSETSPDFGLMYGLKIGRKKYFFSYRMYIPLYPYPIKTHDINALDGNLAAISLEFGVGIRLK